MVSHISMGFNGSDEVSWSSIFMRHVMQHDRKYLVRLCKQFQIDSSINTYWSFFVVFIMIIARLVMNAE